MKIGIIWVDDVRFAALVRLWSKKVDWIYVLCHLSDYSLIFLYLQCQKCDYLEPIIHVPWPNVYNESVKQPQASMEL